MALARHDRIEAAYGRQCPALRFPFTLHPRLAPHMSAFGGLVDALLPVRLSKRRFAIWRRRPGATAHSGQPFMSALPPKADIGRPGRPFGPRNPIQNGALTDAGAFDAMFCRSIAEISARTASAVCPVDVQRPTCGVGNFPASNCCSPSMNAIDRQGRHRQCFYVGSYGWW